MRQGQARQQCQSLGSLFTQRGVSLIETLVALFILVLGVTAALSLVGYVSNITAATRYKIIATNLAREGIEAVRNIRDSNWVFYGAGGARDHWDDWDSSWKQRDKTTTPTPGQELRYKLVLQAGGASESVTDPSLAYKLIPLLNPNSDEEARVYVRKGGAGLPEDAAFYTQNEGEGEATIFARRISIRYPFTPAAEGNNLVEVTSKVSWRDGERQSQVTLVTNLSDWWQRDNHD